MAQINSRHSPNQAHYRSLSQPSFADNQGVPPLSPFPPCESSFTWSNSNLKNVSVEEIDINSRVSSTGFPSPGEHPLHDNNVLPPRRGRHRANIDVALSSSAIIQSSPQLVPVSSQESSGRLINGGVNLGSGKCIGVKRHGIDTGGCSKGYIDGLSEIKSEREVVDDLLDSLVNVNSYNATAAECKNKDCLGSGSKMTCCDVSNSDSGTASRKCTDSREVVKRSVPGDSAPQFRHSRSLSMDSSIGNFSLPDELPKLQSSQADQLSPSYSLAKANFGHGVFNEIELKKIAADERLVRIAISDSKRVKRILANRQSAARSKERKLRYISELEHKVQMLQSEATTLSAQITTLQNSHDELISQNNELKLRIQAMEQQARLRDALHKTLVEEGQQLKLANIKLREEGRSSNGITQQTHMLPMSEQQPTQIRRSSVTTSRASAAAPDKA